MIANDHGAAVPGWAPLRSRDVNHTFGEITTRTRVYTGDMMGVCSDMVMEIESKHNNLLQCPQKTREGNYSLLSYDNTDYLLIILGTSGQYCSRVKDLFNTPVSKQCIFCSDSKQLVDNEYGNLYSFCCITASKMTNCAGIRRRGPVKLTDSDIELDPSLIRHRYGYGINEVPEDVFLQANSERKYYIIIP